MLFRSGGRCDALHEMVGSREAILDWVDPSHAEPRVRVVGRHRHTGMHRPCSVNNRDNDLGAPHVDRKRPSASRHRDEASRANRTATMVLTSRQLVAATIGATGSQATNVPPMVVPISIATLHVRCVAPTTRPCASGGDTARISGGIVVESAHAIVVHAVPVIPRAMTSRVANAVDAAAKSKPMEIASTRRRSGPGTRPGNPSVGADPPRRVP